MSGSKIRQAQLSAAVNCTSLAGAATAAAAANPQTSFKFENEGQRGASQRHRRVHQNVLLESDRKGAHVKKSGGGVVEV